MSIEITLVLKKRSQGNLLILKLKQNINIVYQYLWVAVKMALIGLQERCLKINELNYQEFLNRIN